MIKTVCPHGRFDANAVVYRLTDGDSGPLVAYAMDVTVRCADCGLPFVFLGLPGGLDDHRPTCSFAGTEARLPITPGNLN